MLVEDRAVRVRSGTVPWRVIVPDGAAEDLCVLCVLGWTSAMDTHTPGLRRIAERVGVAVATLDAAGHGRHSEVDLGATTAEQHLAEVVAVHDELRADGYAAVVVLGTSYGGYLAALLSGRRQVRALVLQAPANQRADEFTVSAAETGFAHDREHYLRRMGAPDVLGDSAATRAVQSFDGVVVVVEHELDEVVPSAVPRHYVAQARRGRHVVVRGVAHSPADTAQAATVEDVLVTVLAAIRQDR